MLHMTIYTDSCSFRNCYYYNLDIHAIHLGTVRKPLGDYYACSVCRPRAATVLPPLLPFYAFLSLNLGLDSPQIEDTFKLRTAFCKIRHMATLFLRNWFSSMDLSNKPPLKLSELVATITSWGNKPHSVTVWRSTTVYFSRSISRLEPA